jgi:hypothetical protein
MRTWGRDRDGADRFAREFSKTGERSTYRPPAGIDPAPHVEAGATRWLPERDPATSSRDESGRSAERGGEGVAVTGPPAAAADVLVPASGPVPRLDGRRVQSGYGVTGTSPSTNTRALPSVLVDPDGKGRTLEAGVAQGS